MKELTTLLLILGALVLSGPVLKAQPDAPVDENARSLVSLAKKYYRTQQYLDAAITFQLATQRPYNKLTTFSWYMAGLSFFQMDDLERAKESFNKLLKEYPETNYAGEARYHKSLILMRSPRVSEQERGLEQLFTMMKQAQDGQFKSDIENAIRQALFEQFEIDFLERNLIFADEPYKPWFMEAIAGRMDRQGQGYDLLERLKKWEEEENGTMTDYLADLKLKYTSGKRMHPKRLNVALFLSFNLQLLDTAKAVPGKSKRALQLFEGMQLALDSMGGKVGKEINLAVFDTQADTLGLGGELDSLERFRPDIIVGDIRTSIAGAISDWAEKHKVIHIIPRNPLDVLIDNKRYTFLAHPSLSTHGEQMAHYLVKRRGKRKILVFNDGSYFCSRFARSFVKTIEEDYPEASVNQKIVPNEYKALRDQMKTYMKSLKYAGYDVIYVPLSSEEAAGLIISQLKYYKIEVDIAGGPDWEMFSVIDPELKSNYNLEYSTFYFEKNDSMALSELNELCLRDYGYRPTKYTVQGFDIMAWILNMAKEMNAFTDPVEILRNSPAYHGIHQDFYIGQGQDNQKINVVRFQNGRIDKVNRDEPEQDPVPGSLQGDPGGR
jgi:ABC-type branched-subunit amino acid transport system substrate-binding protein